MHTFAIISTSKETRSKKLKDLLNELNISEFNRIFIQEGTIAEVRNVQRLINYQLAKEHTQALIISDISLLSIEAQQALLKTLEEPPPHTVIFIIGSTREQILPTILSRSQVIYLNSQNVLPAGEEKELTRFWIEPLRNGNAGIRLNIAANQALKLGERETTNEWLDKQIIFFNSLLIKRTGDKNWGNNLTPLQITKILRLLIFTKKYALANVNLKLLLDHLFLNLPSLNN